jgi:hypothetical protein
VIIDEALVSNRVFGVFKNIYDVRKSGSVEPQPFELGCTSIIHVYGGRIELFIRGLDFFINRKKLQLNSYNDYLVQLKVSPWFAHPFNNGISFMVEDIIPCFKNGLSRRRINRVSSEKITGPLQVPIMENIQSCAICQTSPRIINIPCGHVYNCTICGVLAGESCAICRVKVTSRQCVFIS